MRGVVRGIMDRRLALYLALPLALLTIWNPSYAEWCALALIIVAGIPHGAFDLRIAEISWRARLGSRSSLFAAYVFVGGMMSALCLMAPGVGLSLFLIISAIHFIEGESDRPLDVTAIAFGIAAILTPIGLHTTESARYLSFFFGESAFNQYANIVSLCATVLLVCAAALLVVDATRGRRKRLLERTVSLLAWVTLPPLAGFSVWFIGCHSRRHLERCRPLYLTEGHKLPSDFVGISILAILLLAPLSWRFDLSDINQLFAASIILIAGLTLPHMVITRDLASSHGEMSND